MSIATASGGIQSWGGEAPVGLIVGKLRTEVKTQRVRMRSMEGDKSCRISLKERMEGFRPALRARKRVANKEGGAEWKYRRNFSLKQQRWE